MAKHGKPLDRESGQELIRNYRKTADEKATRSVTFSKEIILEALGLDPELETNGINGLKFFFAAYTETAHDGSKLPEGYAGMATLVFAPTRGENCVTDEAKTLYNYGHMCPPPANDYLDN